MKNVKVAPNVSAIEKVRRRAMPAGPDELVLADPYFFDRDQAPPANDTWSEEVLETICSAMDQTGIHPAFIHVFRKTGCLLTEQNIHLFNEADLAELIESFDEYPMITNMIQ